MGTIAEALASVRARIDAAAKRSGRSAESVQLVAVSKTRPLCDLREAVAAGALDLGENYVQELAEKAEALAGLGLRWHMIGHLQRNKVRALPASCEMVHAVDSERLAEEISRRAEAQGLTRPALIEVNIAGEDTKWGVAPAQVAQLAAQMAVMPNLALKGLMAMTPFGATESVARRYFAQVRELAQEAGRDLPPGAMSELSMGMTQDFEVAVEEGATLVRVGTAIFGRRDG